MADEPKHPTTRSTATTKADDKTEDKPTEGDDKPTTVTSDKGTKVQTRRSVADKLRDFS